MKYVIGMDVQGNSVSVFIFDALGNVTAQERAEYWSPDMDGTELADPDSWKTAMFGCIRDAISKNAVDPVDICGIAACGHPNRVVMLGNDGKPVCRSELWSFFESFQTETDRMKQIIGEERLYEICGKSFAVEGALGPFILHQRENEPGSAEKCCKYLYSKDYITFALTGNAVMDVTDASGTMLFDLRERKWSDEILNALGISREVLPEVIESFCMAGTVTKEAAAETGLAEGTHVFGGLTNKASIAVSSGAFSNGSSVPTVSARCDIVALSSELKYDKNRHVESYCFVIPGMYYYICRNNICTEAVGWYAGQYLNGIFEMPKTKGGTPFKPIEDIASGSVPGSNGVTFIPYLNGSGLPGMGENSHGAFIGITASTTKEDMTRAVLEGVSFSVLDCYRYLENVGIKCDWYSWHLPGSAPYWLGMLADMTGKRAVVKGGQGGPSRGAGMIAAIGAGLFDDPEECASAFLSENEVKDPDDNNIKKYHSSYERFRELTDLLG